MNPNWLYGVSFALWAVWLQRHKRWDYLWAATTGAAIIKGTRTGGDLSIGAIPGAFPPDSGGGGGGSGGGGPALGEGSTPGLGPGSTPELPSAGPLELTPGTGIPVL